MDRWTNGLMDGQTDQQWLILACKRLKINGHLRSVRVDVVCMCKKCRIQRKIPRSVRYFQLGDVKIPQDVQKRYLLTLTRQLDSEKEKFVQVSRWPLLRGYGVVWWGSGCLVVGGCLMWFRILGIRRYGVVWSRSGSMSATNFVIIIELSKK